jgi:hypothetical protein
VLWAYRRGLRYTELLQQHHLHPHRFAAIDEDGVVRALPTLCLPAHESFDRSTKSGETWAEDIQARLNLWRTAGGFLQVMNHPDLNQAPLFDFLRSLPREGRLDWTANQACDWWRRTHVAGELTLRTTRRETRIHSTLGVSEMTVELLAPDGRRSCHQVELRPGESTIVSGPSTHAVALG